MFDKFLLIGQSWILQSWVTVSVFVALQLRPPLPGEGLVQVLVCVWFPPPHVKLQELHDDQFDQLPSEV